MRCETGTTTAFWPTSYLPFMTGVSMRVSCMRSLTAHFLSSTSSDAHLDQMMLVVHRHVIVENNIQGLVSVRVHKSLVQRNLDRVTGGSFRTSRDIRIAAAPWRPGSTLTLIAGRRSSYVGYTPPGSGQELLAQVKSGGGFSLEARTFEWEVGFGKVEHQGLPEAQTDFRLSTCAAKIIYVHEKSGRSKFVGGKIVQLGGGVSTLR
jgi:hypothetical protein